MIACAYVFTEYPASTVSWEQHDSMSVSSQRAAVVSVTSMSIAPNARAI